MADLRQPPPPRWRVVERDRKLVVIDTRTGESPASSGAAAPAPSWLPKQIQFDGSAELTTHPFYDAQGPRTIRLDPGSAATIGWLRLAAIGLAFGAIVIAIASPWLLLPTIALGDRRLRARVRQAATAWLNRVEREAG